MPRTLGKSYTPPPPPSSKIIKKNCNDRYCSSMSPLTYGVCKKQANARMGTALVKCDVDWTDPANAKCYHDAMNKYSKEMKKCEILKKNK